MEEMPSFVISQEAATLRFATAIVEIKARAGGRHELDQLTELIDEKSAWEKRHAEERAELTALAERAPSREEKQAIQDQRFAHEIDLLVVAVAFDQAIISMLADDLNRLHREVVGPREQL